MFIVVVLGEFFVTYWMVRAGKTSLFSKIIGTAPITHAMHATCWVLGASVLLVNIIIKKIPLDFFVFIGENVDLESCKHDDHINQLFCKAEDHFHQVKEKIQPQDEMEGFDDDFAQVRMFNAEDEDEEAAM